jgi:hypothetical protein
MLHIKATYRDDDSKTSRATDSPIKRMELGGILVYDAYARINGSTKVQ